MPQMEFNFV